MLSERIVPNLNIVDKIERSKKQKKGDYCRYN